MPALSPGELHQRVVDALGGSLLHASPQGARPLDVDAAPPLPAKLRLYVWTITNPPGGRPADEHKIQLIVPGQQRGSGKTGNFDWSGERAVVVAGYDADRDVFVLWDATKHRDFAYSKNVQVPGSVIQTAAKGAIATHERTVLLGPELIIAAPRSRLVEALARRFDAAPVPVPATPAATPKPARSRGLPYRRTTPAKSEPSSKVFERDPDKIDRATTAHAETQHALSDAAAAAGHIPLSPTGADPQFDLAWIDANSATVVEVKSLTPTNEEKQLRLALGQVLSYAYLLDWEGVAEVRAVIAVESKPTADYWIDLCASHGVTLVWPDTFGTLF